MSQPSPLERLRAGLEYAQDMMEDDHCRCTFCHALRDALDALRELEEREVVAWQWILRNRPDVTHTTEHDPLQHATDADFLIRVPLVRAYKEGE